MAKKFENEKGFLIIQMSTCEASKLGWGTEYGEFLCATCNCLLGPDVYYVAVLNDTMCEECLEEFLDENNRYEEDIHYETQMYEYYAKKLGL